ncbi:hypothetical protein [Ulvibacterium sp.]|nr:hypothetical protein [Ulvibacterium sp.]
MTGTEKINQTRDTYKEKILEMAINTVPADRTSVQGWLALR